MVARDFLEQADPNRYLNVAIKKVTFYFLFMGLKYVIQRS